VAPYEPATRRKWNSVGSAANLRELSMPLQPHGALYGLKRLGRNQIGKTPAFGLLPLVAYETCAHRTRMSRSETLNCRLCQLHSFRTIWPQQVSLRRSQFWVERRRWTLGTVGSCSGTSEWHLWCSVPPVSSAAQPRHGGPDFSVSWWCYKNLDRRSCGLVSLQGPTADCEGLPQRLT
jgi:hypothetical protein